MVLEGFHGDTFGSQLLIISNGHKDGNNDEGRKEERRGDEERKDSSNQFFASNTELRIRVPHGSPDVAGVRGVAGGKPTCR